MWAAIGATSPLSVGIGKGWLATRLRRPGAMECDQCPIGVPITVGATAAYGASRPVLSSEGMTGFSSFGLSVAHREIGNAVRNGLPIVEITHTQADAGEHGDDGDTRGARAPGWGLPGR